MRSRGCAVSVGTFIDTSQYRPDSELPLRSLLLGRLRYGIGNAQSLQPR